MKTISSLLKLREQTFIKPVLSSIPWMTRKVSAILRVFNTYIFSHNWEKNSSVCDTTVSTVNILWSIFGEHCVGPANLEYKQNNEYRTKWNEK